MRKSSLCIACLSVVSLALVVHAQNRKAAKRAKLPTFQANQTSRFFFDDVLAQLQGERPASPNASVATVETPGAPDAATVGESYAWSKIISPSTVEDEVKKLKNAINTSITTPTEFAGKGYKEIRRDFSILAMVFAIINEYDADVRWKKDAAAARDIFARTAANAKAGGNINVYKESKRRNDELTDLMGGSSLGNQPEEQANNWEQIADRNPLMQRLVTGAEENLSKWTSNEDEFSNNIEEVLHEAEIVAAIGEVLIREGMEDGDDEEYAAFAKLMETSALDIVAAVKLNDADQARKANGEIAKACSNCHDNYR
ncbi:MAG: hypothetical protein CMJ64_01605 [Planctomycetaceae bacterium]|nr:hypothetical protein [Planctomycetaceae bacterium]